LGRYNNTAYYLAAFSFKNAPIPKRAIIKSAKLILTSRWWQNKEGSVNIQVEDPTDSTSSLPVTSGLIKDRVRLPGSIEWSLNGIWGSNQEKQSPELKNLIQEAINSPSWKKGNNLTLIIDGENSNNYWAVNSYEQNAPKSAKLIIEYEYTK
jgi:hypothetical protein